VSIDAKELKEEIEIPKKRKGREDRVKKGGDYS